LFWDLLRAFDAKLFPAFSFSLATWKIDVKFFSNWFDFFARFGVALCCFTLFLGVATKFVLESVAIVILASAMISKRRFLVTGFAVASMFSVRSLLWPWLRFLLEALPVSWKARV
jgi:hypothetical protein